MATTSEQKRLDDMRELEAAWRFWGPYLSERQWGTVREDYSANGDAWSYFTHDQARSRAYRWGEDGIAGFCDEKQRLCFALALWNGEDPILKERLFGLTNAEGNHGEDVKEYYFYLDSTPTHSYMKYLYKYPQHPYPYDDLVKTNTKRARTEMEYELLDTGVFDDDRYFDVFVEYAKESAHDILIRITACNRGPDAATLHILPTLWFRNTWSWAGESKPQLEQLEGRKSSGIRVVHPTLGERFLYCDAAVPLLFTENETNNERLFHTPNTSPYVKDGINNFIVEGDIKAVNPQKTGTKAAAHYQIEVPANGSRDVCLRLTSLAPALLSQSYPGGDPLGKHFDTIFAKRLQEADDFYASITPPALNDDQKSVMRQALAGMLWTKQYYYFDLERWLDEHGVDAVSGKGARTRNTQWFHMINDDVISMPDKWEYPWYAAWDLAFHTVALSMVDLDFAKQQLDLMLREVYLHPNGQIPAYEWNFGDVNPPVHAWATYYLYQLEREMRGQGDVEFLKHAFQKLLLNFTWWVNRKDCEGRNVFEGGFLGLDNIGVFDRSSALPTGGYLEQADGTAWMAFFCQTMCEIAFELATLDDAYEPMVLKFIEHFFWIAGAMDRVGINVDEMWDEEDGFFYDLLRLPDGEAARIKVRSLVGLLPFCAVTLVHKAALDKFPSIATRVKKFLDKRPDLVANIHPVDKPGQAGRRLLAIMDEKKLRRVLGRMLDEERFLGDYGIRSLSRWHLDHPYVLKVHEEEYSVQYMPAESNNGMFGGNSNWRGPIWFPINLLILRALLVYYQYYGDDFRVECPTGSGQLMTLGDIAFELGGRLAKIFLRDRAGKRAVYGGSEKFQNDPHWRDHILFYEYFHGDNGAGLGASHQTGWTGAVARLIQMLGAATRQDFLEDKGKAVATRIYAGGSLAVAS
ncbi:MAG TPA: glucosidase [Terriglobales bacterium]|nr:glucosidase [Terriglobales bacterium]